MPIGHTALPRAWSKHTQAKETKGEEKSGEQGAAAAEGGKQAGKKAGDGGEDGAGAEGVGGEKGMKKKAGRVVGGVAVKQAAQEDEGFREFLEGFAYALFTVPEDAVSAMKALDSSIFQGRLLHVLPAHRPPPKKDEDANLQAKTLKERREEERKKREAGGDTRAWSSFYMRPDTQFATPAAATGGAAPAAAAGAAFQSSLPIPSPTSSR
ncbi:unnamed protein product [Closterium sp. NIES-53]